MNAWYLDTSAALKLLLAEPESAALIDAINRERPTLVASYLLETELRGAAHRVPEITQRQVTELLDRIDLYEAATATFTQAGLLPGEHLRPQDALHLASAIAISVERLLTYDARMADAARDSGLMVAAPGRNDQPAGIGQAAQAQ